MSPIHVCSVYADDFVKSLDRDKDNQTVRLIKTVFTSNKWIETKVKVIN